MNRKDEYKNSNFLIRSLVEIALLINSLYSFLVLVRLKLWPHHGEIMNDCDLLTCVMDGWMDYLLGLRRIDSPLYQGHIDSPYSTFYRSTILPSDLPSQMPSIIPYHVNI